MIGRKTYRRIIREDGGGNENAKDFVEKTVNINFYGPVFFFKKPSEQFAGNLADEPGRPVSGPVRCLSSGQIAALKRLPPAVSSVRRKCELS